MALRSDSLLVKGMGWVAVGLAALYWVVESVMDSYLYGLGSLTSRLLSPDINETMMRLLSISLLLGFGYYARTTIDRLSRTETMARPSLE